jgi:hypothetical protein
MAHYNQYLSLRHFLFRGPRQDWFGPPTWQAFLKALGRLLVVGCIGGFVVGIFLLTFQRLLHDVYPITILLHSME